MSSTEQEQRVALTEECRNPRYLHRLVCDSVPPADNTSAPTHPGDE